MPNSLEELFRIQVVNHNLGFLCTLWCASSFLSFWPCLEAIPGSASVTVWDGQDKLHPTGHPAKISQLFSVPEEMGCRNLLLAHELPSVKSLKRPPKSGTVIFVQTLKAFGLCKGRLTSQLQEKKIIIFSFKDHYDRRLGEQFQWDHPQAINLPVPWEYWQSFVLLDISAHQCQDCVGGAFT